MSSRSRNDSIDSNSQKIKDSLNYIFRIPLSKLQNQTEVDKKVYLELTYIGNRREADIYYIISDFIFSNVLSFMNFLSSFIRIRPIPFP